MKKLAIIAVALGTVLAGASAQAAMAPTSLLGVSSNVQSVGIVCGPGMHLRGAVCVRNAGKVCPVGWHLGAGGVCRR